ncbi:hypothetical protein BAE44_0022189 [Dichanthelium oligosanthes]|uniref:F-box domain-containing protein n=1 Tax=Dichanthelium oligosanthes TaxID=888268 RepID=A0A1E5UV81_9POAL|nr:hypothetical protein BAE44_0022189 [Dichanthelium oligosanthes]
MDVLCDTLLLEEILPRLPPKCLLRLGATSRRYNALACSPGFAARYWHRAGVFLQRADEEQREGAPALPRFLAAAAAPACQAAAAAELVPGAGLAEDGTAIVHSAAGLLLCSRGSTRRTLRYYVCNPVTRQRTALPELRNLCYEPQCGLFTVADDGRGAATRFQVVVIEECQMEDIYPSLPFEHDFLRPPPVPGKSGTAYWIQRTDDEAIAYHSASNSLRVIRLPERHVGGRSNRCIGERHGGGGLRFARTDSSALEVWDSETMEGHAWVLAHRVAITELLGQKSDATWHHCRIKPIGFHPTDVDVVFLALPAGVAAYSIEHGTMNLQCKHNCFVTRAVMFPYVHPTCPLQIPANKSSALALPQKRKADESYSKNQTS